MKYLSKTEAEGLRMEFEYIDPESGKHFQIYSRPNRGWVILTATISAIALALAILALTAAMILLILSTPTRI